MTKVWVDNTLHDFIERNETEKLLKDSRDLLIDELGQEKQADVFGLDNIKNIVLEQINELKSEILLALARELSNNFITKKIFEQKLTAVKNAAAGVGTEIIGLIQKAVTKEITTNAGAYSPLMIEEALLTAVKKLIADEVMDVCITIHEDIILKEVVAVIAKIDFKAMITKAIEDIQRPVIQDLVKECLVQQQADVVRELVKQEFAAQQNATLIITTNNALSALTQAQKELDALRSATQQPLPPVINMDERPTPGTSPPGFFKEFKGVLSKSFSVDTLTSKKPKE